MKYVVVFLILAPIIGSLGSNGLPLTPQCLGCICEAVYSCRMGIKECPTGNSCGPFAIQKSYWMEAGSPTLNGEDPLNEKAYYNCVMDTDCAAYTVQLFMQKYGKDCNKDGVIDCDDYAALHTLGKDGCPNIRWLYKPFDDRYKECKKMSSSIMYFVRDTFELGGKNLTDNTAKSVDFKDNIVTPQ